MKIILYTLFLTTIPLLQAMNPESYENREEQEQFELAKKTENRGEKRKTPSEQPPSRKLSRLPMPMTPKPLKRLVEESIISRLNIPVSEPLVDFTQKTSENFLYDAKILSYFSTQNCIEKLLTSSGVDPNKQDKMGQTLINALISFGALQQALDLIKHFGSKLDVSTPDRYGVDPLQNALLQGPEATTLCVNIMRLLNKQNKQIVTLNRNLRFPAIHNPVLMPCLLYFAPNSFDILSNFEYWNNAGRLQEALYIACLQYPNYSELALKIPQLVESGVDLNFLYLLAFTTAKTHYKSDMTILMLAAQQLATNLIDTMLTHGALVDFKDPRGRTALMYVVRDHNKNKEKVLEVMNRLVGANANVTAANNKGKTVLMHAAMNCPAAVTFLLDNGARSSLDETDHNGLTALSYAVQYGVFESINLLLEAGTDLTKIKYEHRLDIARASLMALDDFAVNYLFNAGFFDNKDENGHTTFINLIKNTKVNNDPKINSKLIGELLKLIGQNNSAATNKNGETALMLATRSALNLVKLLFLTHSAQSTLEQKDNKGWTALRHAVENKNIFAIKTLLEAGANADSSDNNHITILKAASKINQGLERYIAEFAGSCNNIVPEEEEERA